MKKCAVVDRDLHEENNYPPKQKSSWDIGLGDYTRDAEYPAAVTLGGGHAANVADTMAIHCNILEAVAGALSGIYAQEP